MEVGERTRLCCGVFSAGKSCRVQCGLLVLFLTNISKCSALSVKQIPSASHRLRNFVSGNLVDAVSLLLPSSPPFVKDTECVFFWITLLKLLTTLGNVCKTSLFYSPHVHFEVIHIYFQLQLRIHFEDLAHRILHHYPRQQHLMACSGTATHPSKSALLWCSKYPRNTRRTGCGKPKYVCPGPHHFDHCVFHGLLDEGVVAMRQSKPGHHCHPLN